MRERILKSAIVKFWQVNILRRKFVANKGKDGWLIHKASCKWVDNMSNPKYVTKKHADKFLGTCYKKAGCCLK